MRKSTVTVASLADGKTVSYTFEGDSILLSEAVEKVGFDIEDADSVERNEVVIPEDELETATVRNGDTIYLIPLVEGGK